MSGGIESRIAKLLAMAEHPNSNPNEAAMAASRAAHLALEHNLDLEELRARGQAPKKVLGRYVGPTEIKRADINAFGFLMTGCGRLYGAAPLFTRTAGCTLGYLFAGEEHNCQLAIKWCEYLWESCKRANTEHARQMKYGSSKAREEARRSFRYAFGLAVLGRLMDKHREMTKPAATSDGRALALASLALTQFKEAEDFLKETGDIRPISSKQRDLEARAFEAGARAGKSVSIVDQLGGS